MVNMIATLPTKGWCAGLYIFNKLYTASTSSWKYLIHFVVEVIYDFFFAIYLKKCIAEGMNKQALILKDLVE